MRSICSRKESFPNYISGIQDAVQVETVQFGGECSEEEIERLAKLVKEKRAAT